jgi:hypothetical protein
MALCCPGGLLRVQASRMGPLNVEDPLYDAFRRHDRYGALGAKPQPFLEYVRLAICALLLLPAKFIGALSCVVAVWAIIKYVSPPAKTACVCMHAHSHTCVNAGCLVPLNAQSVFSPVISKLLGV